MLLIIATAEIRHREKRNGKGLPAFRCLAPTKNHDRYEWFIEKATK
jgi:hypothetical protein